MGNKEAIGIIYDEYIAKPRMYEEFRELFCVECIKYRTMNLLCKSAEKEIDHCMEKINEKSGMWIDYG